MKRSGLSLCILLVLLFGGVAADEQDGDAYDLPGNIAYIGTDYNVYTFNLHAGAVSALTDDASARRQYLWPTWSVDDRLAYFCCNLESGQPFTQIYVSSDGVEAGVLTHTALDTFFNYAYWSPRECDLSDNCRDLAVLLSLLGENQLGVDVIRDGLEAGSEVNRIGTGAPFYYSWSPDGGRILAQRNIRRLDIFNLRSGDLTQFDYTPGLFPAPQWSPIDDRLLVGLLNEDGETTDLAIIANDDVYVIRSALAGELAFNWSPNGDYIAYRTVTQDSVSPLTVVDAMTGETVARSDSEGAFAFFWSPDSRHIAYITVAAPPGTFNVAYGRSPALSGRLMQEDGLRWSILNVETERIRNYGSFIPTEEMLYLFIYFNQFAQSHSIWSPDSSHIVFSEVQSGARRQVSILDTTRPDAVPFSIADGVIGIWSYR